ncbi:hypothetical protein GGF46_001471 [Coemansia sp. RSA 552]|nr:hypothetical protein GGF46_001471 [Coemansia sp. RSA 552]
MACIQMLPTGIVHNILTTLFNNCVEFTYNWIECLPILHICHLWRQLGETLLYSHALVEFFVDPEVIARESMMIVTPKRLRTNIELIRSLGKGRQVRDLVILTPTVPLDYFASGVHLWYLVMHHFADWTGVPLTWFGRQASGWMTMDVPQMAGMMVAWLLKAMPNIRCIVMEDRSSPGLERPTGPQVLRYRRIRPHRRPDREDYSFVSVAVVGFDRLFFKQEKLDADQLRAVYRKLGKGTAVYWRLTDIIQRKDRRQFAHGTQAVFYIPRITLDTWARNRRVFEAFLVVSG